MQELWECRTLGELLHYQALARPSSVALVFGDRRTSYGNLNRQANQVAHGLASESVGPGARVAYLGKNTDWFFSLLFGAAKAGVTFVPVNWRLAAPEINAILTDAGAMLLFVGKGFAEVAGTLDLPSGCRCISLDGDNGRWPGIAAWCETQSEADPALVAEPEATVIQMYTSGTTGLPKGVELSNRNYIAVLCAAEAGGFGAFGPHDVALLCLPEFHIAGVNVGLLGLSHGATVIVTEEFNPALVTDLIPLHRVTFTMLVPAAILLLVQHPKTATADFSSVRILAYGASPIAETLVEQARAVFANAGLWHLYGLTEATGGGTILPPAMHAPELGKLRSHPELIAPTAHADGCMV